MNNTKPIVWLAGFMGLCSLSVLGQIKGRVTKKIPRPENSFVLDTFTLVAPTIQCLTDTSLRFSYNFKTQKLTLVKGEYRHDSLEFSYFRYSFNAARPMYTFHPSLYDSILSFAEYPGLSRKTEKREELFEMPGIQKSGVISRGISVGNGQNGFVNSALNLQLEGQLSKDIRLTAVLSDQSVPFQPQGNTQQIRELDRIYIQLDHKRGQILAGDVVLKNDESAFLRFYKNIQGAQLTARWDSLERSRSRVGAGVAKGKFASVVVQVTEGVQGPYRLRPPNNPDLLMVILANSERIYFDNRLLKRGFNQDYVIDYNTGELTLNNNLLVTRFTRLRCDFEYSERNYGRSVLMMEHEEKSGPVRLQITHYQEQDNPSRPLSFTLDSANAAILDKAGDDPLKAVLPGAGLVAQPIEGQLYYRRIDTVVGAQLRQVFVPARGGDQNVWQVVFSEVGSGNGDYRLEQNLGNGKLYLYVGPGLGSFLPVRQAILPNRRVVSRAAVTLDPAKGHQFRTEAAFSRYDKNRLSRLDEDDNAGNAQFVAYTWKPKGAMGRVRPTASVEYTRLSKHFNGIDRFRDIEFERDWSGSSGDTLAADDHLVQARLEAGFGARSNALYMGAYRNKGQNVRGFQHSLGWQHPLGPLSLTHNAFLMRNDRRLEKSDWVRYQSSVSFDRYALVPRYTFSLDRNAVRRVDSDSVLRTAMNFAAHTFALKSKDSSERFYSIAYTYREDKRPENGELRPNLYSQNAEVKLGKALGQTHRIDLVGNYRLIRYSDLAKGEENLAGRLDYQGSFWDGAFRQELVYTANTGQEARRSFQFIRVNAVGEGTHQWVDYNANGLQELDEFVDAQRTEDRQYIKIFTPTNELIKAYTNGFNYRLNLAAPYSWRGKTGFLKQVSKFSLLSSLTADQKILNGNLSDRYLPFQEAGNEDLMSTNRILRNSLFWNRTQSDFGAEYSVINSLQKTLLSNGFSLRRIEEHRLLIRKNLSSYVNFTQQGSVFQRSTESDALSAQNYRLEGFDLGPEFSFQPNGNHRITGTGQYASKRNQSGEEKTVLWKLGLEYRQNSQSNRTINSTFRLITITHSGSLQSPASYELLEGLQPGRNLTWSLNIQQKLAQGLQLLFTYEGRKSESIPTIHIGKMQANLLF